MKRRIAPDSSPQMEALLPEANPPDLLDPDRLRIGGSVFAADEVLGALGPHVTAERASRIAQVVSRRTRSVAVVVEGLANAGNVSAVMRSAEALGLLSFHVVLGEARYKTSRRTTQGAEKWLDVYRWETPDACADFLKSRDYRLVATDLEASEPLDALDFTAGRTALVFGNEREGLSRAMRDRCDARVLIPISGFAQSFNISVAAAMVVYHVQRERQQVLGSTGDLTAAEQCVLTADYYVRSTGAAEAILRRKRSATR